jgi:hypothetical protein
MDKHGAELLDAAGPYVRAIYPRLSADQRELMLVNLHFRRRWPWHSALAGIAPTNKPAAPSSQEKQ